MGNELTPERQLAEEFKQVPKEYELTLSQFKTIKETFRMTPEELAYLKAELSPADFTSLKKRLHSDDEDIKLTRAAYDKLNARFLGSSEVLAQTFYNYQLWQETAEGRKASDDQRVKKLKILLDEATQNNPRLSPHDKKFLPPAFGAFVDDKAGRKGDHYETPQDVLAYASNGIEPLKDEKGALILKNSRPTYKEGSIRALLEEMIPTKENSDGEDTGVPLAGEKPRIHIPVAYHSGVLLKVISDAKFDNERSAFAFKAAGQHAAHSNYLQEKGEYDKLSEADKRNKEKPAPVEPAPSISQLQKEERIKFGFIDAAKIPLSYKNANGEVKMAVPFERRPFDDKNFEPGASGLLDEYLPRVKASSTAAEKTMAATPKTLVTPIVTPLEPIDVPLTSSGAQFAPGITPTKQQSVKPHPGQMPQGARVQ